MSKSVSRRRFTQSLALIAVAPFASAAAGASATEPADLCRTTSHARTGAKLVPESPAGAPSGPSADATSLAQIVNNRWGERLTTEQLADITSNLDSYLQGAARLSEVPVSNADEPDFVFTPYRSDD